MGKGRFSRTARSEELRNNYTFTAPFCLFGFTAHTLSREKEKSISLKNLCLNLTKRLKGRSKREGPDQFPHTSIPNTGMDS